MKIHHKHLVPLAAFLLLAPLGADTITLADGSQIEGKIVREEGKKVIVEVQVTKNIKDQKTYDKADIKKVAKTPEDEKPFQEISALLPTPDRLTDLDYQGRIKQADEFIKEFPDSKHLGKAKKIRSTLETEAAKVKTGSIKLLGEWIDKEKQQSNAYDIDAMIGFANMKDQVKAGNRREAALDYQSLIEQTPASNRQEKADQLALKLFKSYKQIIDKQSTQSEELIKKREKTMSDVNSSTASRMKDEIERTNALYLAAYEQTKEDGVEWIPTSPYHRKQLEELSSHLESSIQNLERKLADPGDEKTPDLGAAYRNAWEATENKNLEKAEEALRAFQSSSEKPGDSYVQTIEARIETLKTDLKEAKAAAEQEKNSTDEKDASGEESSQQEGETSDMPNSGKKDSDKKQDANKPASPTSTPKSKPATDNTENPSVKEDLAEEEGGNSMMTILYVVIGLAVVAILVMVFSGSKKKKE